MSDVFRLHPVLMLNTQQIIVEQILALLVLHVCSAILQEIRT